MNNVEIRKIITEPVLNMNYIGLMLNFQKSKVRNFAEKSQCIKGEKLG